MNTYIMPFKTLNQLHTNKCVHCLCEVGLHTHSACIWVAWKDLKFSFCSIFHCRPQTMFQFQEWDSRRPHNTNPSLDFLAPEYILTKSCSEKSDIFSFGMLCYAVYSGGRALCSSLNNLLSFKQNVETVRVCVCVCVCV